MEFERRAGAAGPWLLAGWLTASLALIGPAIVWHLDYFRSPGPQFYRWGLILAAALFFGALAYAWLRPRALLAGELPLLAGLAVAAPLLWKPLAAGTVILLLCGALAAGRSVLDRLLPNVESRLERFVLSAGVGFVLYVAALTALGFAGGLRTPLLATLLLVPSLALFGALRRCMADLAGCLRDWRSSSAADHPLARLGTALAFPFLAIGLALALAPAIAHDALMMHLPAMRHYLETHGLEPMPNLSHTYFPQGAELLMACVASIGGTAAAQLVQPLFFVLALAALACVGARAGVSLEARYLGTVLTASMPFLIWTGGVAKNDMPMALFQTLSLLCLIAGQGPARKRWLRLGVLFLAASFTVKYTAAFGGAPLGVLYLWRLRALEYKPRELLLWAGIFAVVAGCWPLRAYWHTGNPVHPVELSWAVESLRPNAMRPAEWRSIPYWKIPWTVHFEGTEAFESPSPNPAGFLLWLFAPLWLLLRRGKARSAETLCLVFAWIYFFYWGSVWPVVRYAIVPIGLLTTLTADRLLAAWRLWPAAWKPAFASALALNGVPCLLAAMIVSVNAPQFALFLGRIDERAYLRQTLITYPVLERLADEIAPGDWTLAVDVGTLAHAPDPTRFQFEYLVDDPEAPNLTPGLLRERQYTFLITPVSAVGVQVLSTLPAGVIAEQLFEDAHFTLSRLQYEQ